MLRFFGFPITEASHPHPGLGTQEDPHGHLSSIARPDAKALWCVHPEAGTGVQQALAAFQVSSVIYDEQGWHEGVSNPRFRFVGSAKDCSQTADPNIEIDITVAPCFTVEGAGYSCAEPFAQVGFNDFTGHYEFRRYSVMIWADHWNPPSDKVFFINHELGHVFGLSDGGPDVFPGVDPGDPPCPDPPSIMHTYGCDRPRWPSVDDFDSVRDEVVQPPPPTAGGNAFSKAF